MGNTIFSLKPRNVVYMGKGTANGGYIALILESAPDRTAGYFGDGFVYDHVYNETFSHTRHDDIVLDTKLNS